MADNTNTLTNDETVQIELSTQEPTDTTQEKLYMKILRDYNETEHDGLMTLSNTDSTQDVLYPVTRIENVVDSTGKSLDTIISEINTKIDGYSPINGIVEEYQVAAGENISAGDFVEYVNEQMDFYDGGVVKDTSSRLGSVKAVKLNDTDVLLSWVTSGMVTGESNYGWMVVYRFSDKQISAISTKNITDTLSPTTMSNNNSDIFIENNKILHFYEKASTISGGTTAKAFHMYCRIITWNGTELSFGTEKQVFSFETNWNDFKIVKVNNDGKYLLLHNGNDFPTSGNEQLTGTILNITSTMSTPTIGTPVLFDASSGDSLGKYVCGVMLNDSKCLVVAFRTSTRGVSFVVDVSSNSPTIASTNNNPNVSAFPSSSSIDIDYTNNYDLIKISEQYAIFFACSYITVDSSTYERKYYTTAYPIEIDSSFSTNFGYGRQVPTLIGEYYFKNIIDKGNRSALLICSNGNGNSACDMYFIDIYINDFEIVNEKQYTNILINGILIGHGTNVLYPYYAIKMSNDCSTIAVPYISISSSDSYTAALGILYTDKTKRKGIISIENKEKILGVAKVSGIAGETIQIYTPNITTVV